MKDSVETSTIENDAVCVYEGDVGKMCRLGTLVLRVGEVAVVTGGDSIRLRPSEANKRGVRDNLFIGESTHNPAHHKRMPANLTPGIMLLFAL